MLRSLVRFQLAPLPKPERRALGSLFCLWTFRLGLQQSGQSAVVEPQGMDPGECPLPRCPRPCQCLRREVVDKGCRSNPLGEIASSVVALNEHPTGILGSQRQSSVPNVRNEEGDVTRLGHNRNRSVTFPLQVVVGQSLPGRCLSRGMTSWNHPRRTSVDRAVLEVEVGSDREHGIGDSWVPRNAGITRYVWSAVDMPETSEMLVVAGLLPPRRIGDHVAVLTQEELDDLEYLRVADSLLDQVAPIEHLVAKWSRSLGRISPIVRWVFIEDPLDVRAKRCEFCPGEDAVELYVSV
jgi:hypothetical protein